MISWHPRPPDLARTKEEARYYWRDWRTVDTGGDVERIVRGITRFVWGACVWHEGVRREDHFLTSDWAVLDFDNGEMTLADAENSFCDMTHVIATTKSHQKDKGGVVCDRFRVVLRFSERVKDCNTYRSNIERLCRAYPADRACIDGARFFWPCTDIVSVNAEGYTEDVSPADPRRDPIQKTIAFSKKGVLPAWVIHVLSTAFPQGHHNTNCYKLGLHLTLAGFTVEEIFQKIVASPSYENRAVSPSLEREIRYAIGSGRRRAERALKEQQSDRPEAAREAGKEGKRDQGSAGAAVPDDGGRDLPRP